jgi:hypothetical protein
LADISHKNLTSNQIHEPKGADTATANKVYVSNGSGSGTWKKIETSEMEASAKPFAAQLFHIRDQQAQNTASSNSSFSTGSWTINGFNTIVTNEISGALSSGAFTLPAGTYFLNAVFQRQIGGSSGVVRVRLQNVTDSTTALWGPNSNMNFFNPSGGGSMSGPCVLMISGRFTINDTKTFEIQGRTTNSSIPLAPVSNLGPEVYSDAFLWKIA